MKNKTLFISASAFLLAALMPALTQAQAPSGIINTSITDPTNAVWDLTEVEDLNHVSFEVQDVGVAFDVNFIQDGKGKVAGAGNTTVSIDDAGNPQPPFPATYSVKGSITSSKGVGRLSFSANIAGIGNIEGLDRKVSASEKVSLIIDPVSRQIVSGTFSGKASAAGLGTISDSGPIDPEPLPDELGDGSWTLSMNLQPDLKNKFTGTNNTATVTLMTGRVYTFSVLGSYVPTTQTTKLVLKGTGDAVGSSLKVTLLNNSITGILGKIAGQAISVK